MCAVKLHNVLIDRMAMEQGRIVAGMREDLPIAREFAAYGFLNLGEKLPGGLPVKTDIDFLRGRVDAKLFNIELPCKNTCDTRFNTVWRRV